MENSMNKTMIAIAAALGIAATTATASAQGTGFYVGAAGAVQGRQIDNNQWGGTLTAGYRLNQYLSLQALGDFSAETSTARGSQAGFATARAGFPLGQVNPYVLAGAGYGIGGMSRADNTAQPLWTAGLGMAYNLNERWQVDVLYRRIEAFSDSQSTDRMTVGINYRF
jgi:opacity protein-like surface antigen